MRLLSALSPAQCKWGPAFPRAVFLFHALKLTVTCFLLCQDIVTIGMLSLPCGWLCTTIGLPTMFGYIICGVLLGPSGLNSIKVRTKPVSLSAEHELARRAVS